jgi:hypothetical protein
MFSPLVCGVTSTVSNQSITICMSTSAGLTQKSLFVNTFKASASDRLDQICIVRTVRWTRVGDSTLVWHLQDAVKGFCWGY